METKNIKLTIDGYEVEVSEGTSVLQAAASIGMQIPTMCHKEGHKAQTSCMMCLVKVNGNPNLVTSCSRPAEDGMVVENNCEEIINVRKTTMDLMLSDHIGDCVAPCSNVCPAYMEIPQMLRQVTKGENLQALITVKRDIAFPGILGRICPEICEGGCRRGTFDNFESICLVKRFVADDDLKSAKPWIPQIPNNKEKSNKTIAVIGTGPAGMSCAYYLLEIGYKVVLFDANEEAGGALRYRIPENELPRSVLDAELHTLTRMGAEFKMGVKIGEDITMPYLQEHYDSIFIGVGKVTDEDCQKLGIKSKNNKPVINRSTFETSVKGIFAGGGMTMSQKHAIRSLAVGKTSAMSIDQYLSKLPIVGRPQRFTSKIGRITKDEIENLLEENVNQEDRYHPDDNQGTCFSKEDHKGFTEKEAQEESSRCLHCDCRAKDDCDLRDFSELYAGNQKRFAGKRRPISRLKEGEKVHLDTGKCIQCGLCVQISHDGKEEIGLSYENRGFNTNIVAPLGYSMDDALTHTAKDAADSCPTGALEIRKEEDTEQNPTDLFKHIVLDHPSSEAK